MALSHLLYMSYESYFLTEKDLRAILEKAQANNQRYGITGILLYSQGSFMQVIEGEEKMILRLWGHLHRDPRHKDLRLLFHEKLETRNFPDWCMSFRIVKPEHLPPDGFCHFLQKDEARKTMKGEAINYLLSFKEALPG